MWIKIFTMSFDYLQSTIKNEATKNKYRGILLVVAEKIATTYGYELKQIGSSDISVG